MINKKSLLVVHYNCMHFKSSLPELEEQILMKLAEAQRELDRYGSGPPTEQEHRICFLTDVSDKKKSSSEVNELMSLNIKLISSFIKNHLQGHRTRC